MASGTGTCLVPRGAGQAGLALDGYRRPDRAALCGAHRSGPTRTRRLERRVGEELRPPRVLDRTRACGTGGCGLASPRSAADRRDRPDRPRPRTGPDAIRTAWWLL